MRIFLALLLLSLSHTAFAFDGVVHKLICSTAYDLSKPQTKTFIDKVMDGDKRVAKGMSFSDGCNWPDEVRGTTHKSTYRFHFMNVPRAQTFNHKRDCATYDCVTQAVQRYALNLAKTDISKRNRKEALLFLGHFVADIHQPLHIGNAEDWGGNKIKVYLSDKDKKADKNLHYVWDTTLPAKAGFRDADAEKKLIKKIEQTDTEQWQNFDVISWAKESFLFARKNAYAFPDGLAVLNQSHLTHAYYEEGKRITYQRVMEAAVRLSFLLNEAAQGDIIPNSFYHYQQCSD